MDMLAKSGFEVVQLRGMQLSSEKKYSIGKWEVDTPLQLSEQDVYYWSDTLLEGWPMSCSSGSSMYGLGVQMGTRFLPSLNDGCEHDYSNGVPSFPLFQRRSLAGAHSITPPVIDWGVWSDCTIGTAQD